MSDLLIKGMKMPKSCYECNFRLWDAYEEDDTFTCLATDGEFGTARENERRDFCPLVEIPPHGRLIDADALDHQIYYDIPLKAFGNIARMVEMRKIVEQAPTIIEAEGVNE